MGKRIVDLSVLKKRRLREVQLPVSGLTVNLRSLTEKEWSWYLEALLPAVRTQSRTPSQEMISEAGRRLIVLSLCDAEGNRLLENTQAAEISEWDSVDVQVLQEAALTHCSPPAKNVSAASGGN
jgi:hypothetical protein